MPRRRLLRTLVLAAAPFAGAAAVAALAAGAWTPSGGGDGGALAAADWRAPVVTMSAVSRAGTTVAGYVSPGGAVVVYANVVDPNAGVPSVTADVAALAPAVGTAALTPCTGSCTVGGTTYGWATAPISVAAGLAEGPVTYTVSAADSAGNASAPAPFAATVDGTTPGVSAAVVATTAGAVGSLRQGAAFQVYANAADPTGATGAVGSGVSTVTADLSALVTGATAVALANCTSSCTVGGVTYGYKSAVLTAADPLADGAKSFTVSASDKAANTSPATAFSATVDNVAPVIQASTIVAGTGGGVGWLKAGGTYVLYAKVADAGTGANSVTADVSAVTANATATALATCTSACTVGGVTYTHKTSIETASAGLAEGAISFSVTAVDKASNPTTTGGFSVTVDNTPATVTAAVVANTATSVPGWAKQGGAYVVYANVSDAASGISSVTTNVSALTSAETALALVACTTACTVGSVTYGWKSTSRNAANPLAEGAKSFTITAVDKAGVSTIVAGSPVTIDNTAPAVTAAAVANTATGSTGVLSQGGGYAVYAAASDGASGVRTVTANLSTVTAGQTAVALPACTPACSAGGVSYPYATAALTANATLSEGAKTYMVTAQDAAGNSATLSGGAVTVDNTAPVVAITFPTAAYSGGWAAGCGTPAADICGTASDASAGVLSAAASIRQAAAPASYWATATGTFSSATEVLLPATLAGTTWTLPFAASRFTKRDDYTIRAVATDAAGNMRQATVTFTYRQ